MLVTSVDCASVDASASVASLPDGDVASDVSTELDNISKSLLDEDSISVVVESSPLPSSPDPSVVATTINSNFTEH